MMGDGLYEPLGRDPVRRPTMPVARILIGCVAGVAAIVVIGMAWWHRSTTLPSPVVAEVPLPSQPAPSPPAPVPAVTSPAPLPPVADDSVRVIRPPNSPAFSGTFIKVPSADPNALPPAPDGRLVEKSRYGLLPRRGPDGATPARVYSRPVGSDVAPGAPRIALFIGGMGLNPALTAAAAQALPPAVTLGFAPYGGDVSQQVERARTAGHEVVLQVPMQAEDGQDGTVPTPHTLRTDANAPEIIDALHWQMTRFTGYAGVASLQGAKFTAEAPALTPVLRDVADRGLFFVDDGTSPHNLAATLAPSLGLPVVKADVVIDALGEPETVDASLRKLEKIARAKGSAVGATAGLPTMVDRLAAFAVDMSSHGVAIVPVSALAEPSIQASSH